MDNLSTQNKHHSSLQASISVGCQPRMYGSLKLFMLNAQDLSKHFVHHASLPMVQAERAASAGVQYLLHPDPEFAVLFVLYFRTVIFHLSN